MWRHLGEIIVIQGLRAAAVSWRRPETVMELLGLAAAAQRQELPPDLQGAHGIRVRRQ